VNEITVLDVYSRHIGIDSPLDVVLIGTQSSLLALDIYDNKTVFHKEMPEGVCCLKVVISSIVLYDICRTLSNEWFQIGKLDDRQEPVIMCGCGTTIWGFGIDGSDAFWTALGEDITALEVLFFSERIKSNI
jgi:Bardet-Biedl syndrome 2 protein